MALGGIAAGALWGGVAGWLKARFGVNEIITTLMLNYIAIQWVRFWVFGPWSEGGFQLSKQFPREAWLPRLTDFAKLNSDLGGLTTHLGLPDRHRVRVPRLVAPVTDAAGLRDPPHRGQPPGGPVRGHQHRADGHPGDAHVGWPGGPRRACPR